MPFPNDAESTADFKKSLARKRIGYDEPSLINVLENESSGKMLVYYAVLGLRDVGTGRCIPALKRMLHYPKQDVKDCSILTISHIAGAAETEFYVSALTDKRTRKTYPMWAMLDAADERAVPAVIEYLRRNRNNFDLKGMIAGTYMMGIAYLAKFRSADDRIEGILTDFRSLWESIPSFDRNTVLSTCFFLDQLAGVIAAEEIQESGSPRS